VNAKLAMVFGVLTALWVLALTLIGGAMVDGYDHNAQFISELGATGAPYGQTVSWLGFLPAGVFGVLFALFAWLAAPRSLLATLGFVGIVLFAIGYIGAAFFPCDFGCRPAEPSASQVMHNLGGLAGYFLAPLTLAFLSIAARKWPNALYLVVLGVIGGVSALLALTVFEPDFEYVGMAQRVLEASVLTWIAACGIYLGTRRTNETAAR